MLNDLLFVVGMVGIFRVLIYAIGEPHDEFNAKSILSAYTSFLAFIRLNQLQIRDYPKLGDVRNLEQEILNKEAIDAYLVERVRPVAGWLNAVGFCPTCTSVWFFLLAVLVPTGSIAMYGIALLISKIVFKWS